MLELKVFLVLTSLFYPLNCDYVSSISGLEDLVHSQILLTNALDKYLVEETKRLDELKEVREDIIRLYQQSSRDVNLYLDNPINILKLIKLSHVNAIKVKSLTQSKSLFNQEVTLKGPNNASIFEVFPKKKDIMEGYLAIARLQYTYDLELEDLSQGIVKALSSNLSSQSLYTLNSYDFLEIYKSLKDLMRFSNDVDIKWCKQAFKIYEAEKVKLVSQKELFRKCQKMLHKNTTPFYHPMQLKSSLYHDYLILCKNEIKLRPTKYKCYFKKSTNQPYLTMYRIKVEEIHRNPDVYVFHDVLSDREIEELKSISKRLLRRSGVLVYDKGSASSSRVSKVGWVHSSYNNFTHNLMKRFEVISGLSGKSAEHYQISNYGLGGQFEPHVDHFLRNSTLIVNEGNRIATFLMYLSDVEAGGHTVFPLLGIGVPPQKGSALFWYNLKKNGEGNQLTLHASCPVLLGSKWIAALWFHEFGQEFLRSCDLKFLEPYKLINILQ